MDNWNRLKIEDTDTNSCVKTIFKPVEITPEALKFNCVQKAKALRENKMFSFRTLLKYSNDRCPVNKVSEIAGGAARVDTNSTHTDELLVCSMFQSCYSTSEKNFF